MYFKVEIVFCKKIRLYLLYFRYEKIIFVIIKNVEIQMNEYNYFKRKIYCFF